LQFKKDGKYYIQINDKVYEAYDDAGYLTFSNDSSKYGWWFKKDDKKHIQINDKVYGPYDKARFIFTPDSKIYLVYFKDKELVIEKAE